MIENSNQKQVQAEYEAHRKRMEEAENLLACAIGKFSMRFATLERYTNWAIAVFVKPKNDRITDLIFAAIRNVSTRLDILQSLVNGMAMPDIIREELKSCVVKIRDLNSYRNWLLHDPWGALVPANPDSMADGAVAYDYWQKIRYRTDSKFHLQHKDFSATEIEERADECWKVVVDLSKTMKKYDQQRDQSYSSPQKS